MTRPPPRHQGSQRGPEAARHHTAPGPRVARTSGWTSEQGTHTSPGAQKALAFAGQVTVTLAGMALTALARTMIKLARVRAVGLEDVLRLKAAGRRILLVSWHGYDLCNLGVYPTLYGRDSRAVIMAPTTWEGMVMERLVKGFGYDVIPIGADPNSRLSVRGVVEMASRIKDGCDGMIAVDGPFGPPEEAKLGAAVIAKRASAVVVPTVVAGSHEFRIRSRWDKHLLIPPFTRMLIRFGPIIDTTPADGTVPSTEEIRQRIEASLRRSNARTRAMVHGDAVDA